MTPRLALALLAAAALAGCVYAPGPDPYAAYGYAPYRTQGTAPAATDYNPVSGSRTGSD